MTSLANICVIFEGLAEAQAAVRWLCEHLEKTYYPAILDHYMRMKAAAQTILEVTSSDEDSGGDGGNNSGEPSSDRQDRGDAGHSRPRSGSQSETSSLQGRTGNGATKATESSRPQLEPTCCAPLTKTRPTTPLTADVSITGSSRIELYCYLEGKKEAQKLEFELLGVLHNGVKWTSTSPPPNYYPQVNLSSCHDNLPMARCTQKAFDGINRTEVAWHENTGTVVIKYSSKAIAEYMNIKRLNCNPQARNHVVSMNGSAVAPLRLPNQQI